MKRGFVAGMLLAFSCAAIAQQARPPRAEAQPERPHAMTSDERLRLRQDVDAARRAYRRQEPRRPGHLGAEEREQLRRDVQNANREIRRR